MGVWMKQIPVKLPLETVERVRAFAVDREIPVGLSTAIRHMVEDFLSRMSSGIVQFAAEQGNRVPSVQSIPGTPNEFPATASTLAGPKPLTRIAPKVGVRGRAIRSVSQRRAVGAGVRLAYMPHFPGKVSPIKSNSYVSARCA